MEVASFSSVSLLHQAVPQRHSEKLLEFRHPQRFSDQLCARPDLDCLMDRGGYLDGEFVQDASFADWGNVCASLDMGHSE